MNRAIQATLLMLAVAAVLALAPAAWAQTLTIPNTFSNNTAADATQVNANFTAVKSTVDSHNTAINALGTAKQNKVTGSCAVGSAIRFINTNGTVTCQTVSTGIINVAAFTARERYIGDLYQTQIYYPAGSLGRTGNSIAGGYSDFMVAPVQLPHGATVTRITLRAYDNSSVDLCSYLYRTGITSGSVYSVCTTGASTLQQVIASPTLSHLVDNNIYAYFVYFQYHGAANAATAVPIALKIEYTQ